MNKEKVIKYIKETYAVMPEYLWPKYPFYAVFRTKKKWFGIIMNVPKEKLGLKGKEEINILNVKCLPEMIGSLRKSPGFIRAYHMNKEHWITILLDGSVALEKIEQLIAISYDLVSE